MLWNPSGKVEPIKTDKIKCLPNLVTAKLCDNEPIPLFLLSMALSLSIKMTWPRCVPVPIFYNLTQLELFSNLMGKTWPKKWNWIVEMLQHTPKLQHLIIHEEIENGNDDVDEDIWENPKIVPECLSSNLKTCLFKNYRGKKCELQFVDYVMRSSKVLSSMTIHCACSTNLNAKYQMLQKLSLCLRGCIFERFRGILHEGEIDKRVQFLIEGLFAIIKAIFQDQVCVTVSSTIQLVTFLPVQFHRTQ
ncbi:hypothetical protein QL285_071943 [Trifolium repens]|nr:hypothetical protein QL285_071943 [Trifolium repens]